VLTRYLVDKPTRRQVIVLVKKIISDVVYKHYQEYISKPTSEGKVKGFQYSLPSIGFRANPCVQAVTPQMTISHQHGGRLPLLSARPAVT